MSTLDTQTPPSGSNKHLQKKHQSKTDGTFQSILFFFFFGDSGGERLATHETEAEARAENSDEPGRFGCPAVFKTERKKKKTKGGETTSRIRVDIRQPHSEMKGQLKRVMKCLNALLKGPQLDRGWDHLSTKPAPPPPIKGCSCLPAHPMGGTSFPFLPIPCLKRPFLQGKSGWPAIRPTPTLCSQIPSHPPPLHFSDPRFLCERKTVRDHEQEGCCKIEGLNHKITSVQGTQ